MTDNTRYRGQVVIVTGGASGIGAALGRQMARAGAHVVLADRQLDLAEHVAESIRSKGGSASTTALDVRDAAALRNVVSDTVGRYGGVHFFFNNAGIGVGGEVEHYQPRDWDDVFDVNLRGVAYGIQAVYPVMIQQGAGHIINTASVAGLLPTPGETSYCASKYAVVGLSKALRIEAKRHNVRVSALCPGAIRTPILTGGKFGRTNHEGVTDENLLSLWEQLRPMDPDVFAAKVVAQLARNPAIIVVPSWWKVMWYLERFAPSASEWLAGMSAARLRKSIQEFGGRPVSQAPAARELENTASESKLA
jgi:NAD(P)-dependent dehydrogenase (short-subunit alcohol dehydrogenase family)